MIIEQEVLNEAVKKIVSVCERPTGSSSTLQHFFHIKFHGSPEGFKLSASNMVRRVEVLIPGIEITEQFCFGVMGMQLNSLLSELPDTSLTLDYNQKDLLISAGRCGYHLPTIQRDSFPTFTITPDTWTPFDIEKFLDTLSKLSFCTSTIDNRPLYTKAACLTEDLLLCTDGYRMCFTPNSFLKIDQALLFPVESIKSFLTLFKGCKDGFICVEPDRIHFSSQGSYASTSLMSGKVPNFKAPLPQGVYTPCTIPKGDLQSALKRISVCSKTSPAEFTFDNNMVFIRVNADSFRGQESVPCSYEGPATRMLLNHGYIRQAVKGLEGDKILFELRGQQMPLLVTDDKGSFKNVIMPQRDEGL